MPSSFQLETIDYVVFVIALLGVMAVGMIVGRKEETAEDYFLAGRKLPWYGIAGSIFGSNVSANHLVGMMGIGFSIGFAQSHFELGAIAALLLLCYGLLPVYRKLNLYTLSDYLGKRFDERSRIAYTLIMILIMAVVQMVPGLYIGSRSICFLLGGDALDVVVGSDSKTLVNDSYYTVFVIALGVISATYTILGGLKAVVWTDVIQSVLMLISGIGVALVTFMEFGGWDAMMVADKNAGIDAKMHLYLPVDHPELPWTGALTGLMFMHCFYWGTNQFIVQRALAARSDREARIGIIAAGYLKLLIPFFSIATGVAAFYLFQESPEFQGQRIDPDTAFTVLVSHLIAPGFVGLIAAGLIGAILSSIDSMMNSTATLFTVDIYKQHLQPKATEREMIFVGRVVIVIAMIVAILMAIMVMDPNSEHNFFLQIVDYQNYLTPGLLVSFILGMFWKRGTATASFITILMGIVFSGITVIAYDQFLGSETALLGEKLNFFHRVVVVIGLCATVFVGVSLNGKQDMKKSVNTWMELSDSEPGRFVYIGRLFLLSIMVYAVIGILMVQEVVSPQMAGGWAASYTMVIFVIDIIRTQRKGKITSIGLGVLLRDDRIYAGLLSSCTIFVMYLFY
ncbi:MAG: sodium/solute symporter [Planctomycetota bacterium]|nr:sodium/solute symporter [Planctomycetota bacterium]